ncbi:MAG: CARDB domain-containing protein [Nocardioides sp.]|nr:CARDB domain-containing protein [Nocardioides sp.]
MTRYAVPFLTTVVGMSLLAVTAAPADAAVKRADLTVVSATVSKTTLAEGDNLVVSHVVKNRGTAKATATQTRFYLSANVAVSRAERVRSRTNPRSAPQDVLLMGAAAVVAVRPGKRVSVRSVKLTVPVGTAAGSYSVLVCTDDRGTVREKSETNNCTPAAKRLAVKVAPGSATLRLQTFGAGFWRPSNEYLGLIKAFCGAVRPAKAMTLGAALTSARSFLSTTAGADALTKLGSSSLAATADQAEALAATAVTKGSPGLALAALLKAHGLEPRNANHLVNAAAMATSVGLPNEAIAMLDAAQTLDLRRPAMGISQRAISMTVRGQALTMTGRASAARGYFLAARAAAPLLSEADTGLATIEACEDEDAKAARFLRKSRTRTQTPTKPDEEPPPPGVGIDLSQGTPSKMRQLPIAETPRQAVVMEAVYDGIEASFHPLIDAQNAERQALEDHLEATDELRTQAEIRLRDGILSLTYASGEHPSVEVFEDVMDARYADLLALREEFWGGGTGEMPYTYNTLLQQAFETCSPPWEDANCVEREMRATCGPALTGAHSRWRALMAQLRTAANGYFAALSTRASAYASNLEDEEAHRLALLHIEGMEWSTYAGLVQQGQFWTHLVRVHEDHCVPDPEADAMTPEDAEAAASKGNCPDALKATSFVLNLGPTVVKVNCEKISQELAGEVLPLLQAFVEVTYDFRAGTVTVVAGAKGTGKLGGVVENGFKSGVYVTAGTDGSLKDAGWRVGPSTTVGTGPLEVEAVNQEIDISFVSGLRGAG